jgi:type I restriction enzyme S subunit
MPESWEYVSSDALFLFVTSGSRGWAKYYSESGPIFIRVGNLNHNSIALDLSRIQHVDPPRGAERQRTGVRGGDILISITADVGMIGLVPEHIGEAYINQHVAISRPVDGVYRPFVAWYLASGAGGQALFEDLQRGATKVGLGLDDIKSLRVPFPPIEEQWEIVHRVEALFKLSEKIAKNVEAELSRTEKMTQSILAKAFRGELVPTEAELARREGRSEESAQKRLARITAEHKQDSQTVFK